MEFDEQHAELRAHGSDASDVDADAVHQAFAPQLGEVVAKLTEAVVSVDQPMAGLDARQNLARGRLVSGGGFARSWVRPAKIRIVRSDVAVVQATWQIRGDSRRSEPPAFTTSQLQHDLRGDTTVVI